MFFFFLVQTKGVNCEDTLKLLLSDLIYWKIGKRYRPFFLQKFSL